MAATCTLLLRSIDLLLLLPFFLILSVSIPLIDSQACVPSNWAPLHPKPLTDLKRWYVEEYGDYLMTEMPPFFAGLVWVEVFLLWPLSVACSYGILARKKWFGTSCLMAGVSTATSMTAIMAELLGSGRGSTKLCQMHVPFAVLSVVATLRGLVPCSSGNRNNKTSNTFAAQAARKKRA